MLNFKGKMYKLCEKKDMDRQAKQPKKSVSVSVPKKKPMKKSKSMPNMKPKKPKATHKMPSGDIHTGKKHTSKSKLVKKAPQAKQSKAPKSAPKAPKAPKKAPKAPKKGKKQIKVEGFPVFKGDEPKAKEEKRRDNNLY